MFYSQFILAKKGPLGTIWIAAHLERKLRKNQVADTDIGVSVDSIIFPEVPIALRLSSHLLLGVVRIYSRKVNYLFDDCSEALLKVKQAFRSTAVDLPPEEATAPYHSITLPETFDLDDFELPDHEMHGNYVDHHISSKDQITLQDTMDGMVYSTSQFGLDETFGDGDASLIGLDLEEDLLLNKPSAPDYAGDNMDVDDAPTTSIRPDDPIKDENNEKMNERSKAVQAEGDEPKVDCRNSELLENAQAPSTPGLVEEPNLSNQKTSAHDDHFEQDSHLPESERQEKTTENCLSLPRSGDGEENHIKDNGHMSTDPALKLSEPESSLNQEFKDPTALGDTRKPRELNTDDMEMGDDVPTLITVEEAPDMGNLSKQPCSDMGDVIGNSNFLVSNGSQLDGQGTTVPKASENTNAASQVEESLSPKMTPESVNLQLLKACNSDVKLQNVLSNGKDDICLDQPSDAEAQRDTMKVQDPCKLAGTTEPIVENNQLADTSQHEKSDQTSLNEKIETALPKDGVEASSSPTTSELPSPEKMLSVPEEENELPAALLPDFTSQKVQSTVDEDGTGNISGQKRSFTESTLTADSYTAESFEKDRLKRTAESIPDDEDLLSSILVGRRSLLLKMKPTPAATEIVSMKRPRTASRNITYKRKVLMDDSMVLHGDAIRQQLVSTEDIRRVRKKAPCTHRGIWMIQKLFLEEDIVYDPISTGMSMELVCLHNQAYELSGIHITTVDEPKIVMESTLDVQPLVDTDIIPDTQTFSIEEANVETQLFNPPTIVENQPNEGETADASHDNGDFQNGVSSATLPLRNSVEEGQATEMEVDTVSVAVVEAAVHVSSLSFQSASPSCLIQGDVPEAAPGCVTPLSDQMCNLSSVNGDAPTSHDSGEAKIDTFDSSSVCHRKNAPLGAESRMLIELPLNESGNGESVQDKEISVVPTAPEPDHFDSDIGKEADTVDNDGNSEAGALLPNEQDVNSERMSPIGGQNALFDEFYGQQRQENGTADVDGAFIEDYYGMDNVRGEHDTGFLNVDDYDLEDDDSYMPSVGESRTQIVDNSGWSSRSRAVAKYLQTLFDKEAEHGKNVIPMDNLLKGKSRKEASRMFFESLVLKTKDYIQVDQSRPFNNINIKPQSMLMKSDF